VINSLWYPHIYDEKTTDSLLVYQITQGEKVTVTTKNDTNVFKAEQNWFGIDTLRLLVTDFGKLTISSPLIVAVNSVNDIPEFQKIPDSISFIDSSYEFNIWVYVSDVETPDSLLIYNFQTKTDSLLISFTDSTGQVLLTSLGYFGNTELYITVTDDSTASISDTLLISIKAPTVIKDVFGNIIPEKYILFQNHPNPFNPETIITFGLPEPAWVKIEIFNMLGQKVVDLFEGNKPAGYHQVIWDAHNYSSGVYVYRVYTQEKRKFDQIKKMVFLK
jgi:hypothetical protein